MAEEATSAAPSEPGPSKLPLIIGGVNTLLVLAAAGVLAYTQLIFKRPQITEQSERARIAAMKSSPGPGMTSGYVSFEPMTINIAPSVPQVGPVDGGQNAPSAKIQGKLHYATIGFSLELKDISRDSEVEAIRPLILDQFLGIVGRKQFQDLTSIEGRYVLKTELIEVANELAKKRLVGSANTGGDPGPLVSNLFFNQFIVQ